MLKKLVASALFAGLAAGVVASVLHFAMLVPIIIEAEQYESGQLTHFTAAPDTAAQPAAEEGPDTSLWHRDTDPVHRGIMTFGMELITYTGFALILIALFAAAERYGHQVTAREGILWGLAGFLALHVAPAAGLPPETPGIPAADITARQMWWIGTALATGVGIALIAFGRSLALSALALVLIVIPHIVGAPHLEELSGVVPPSIEGMFAGRSIAVAALSWSVLGFLAGWFWNRNRAA